MSSTYQSAINQLKDKDKILAEIISKVGPCTLKPQKRRSVYVSLINAVANQQLNGKAAKCVLKRLKILYNEKTYPPPKVLVRIPDDKLRAVGFSYSKVNYLKGIARAITNGSIPNKGVLMKMDDEGIITLLSSLNGIGRWSAEMLLIFTFGRLDVLPADDYGLKRAFTIFYKKRNVVKRNVLIKHGNIWKPYRTIASWYLWKYLDIYTGNYNAW